MMALGALCCNMVGQMDGRTDFTPYTVTTARALAVHYDKLEMETPSSEA